MNNLQCIRLAILFIASQQSLQSFRSQILGQRNVENFTITVASDKGELGQAQLLHSIDISSHCSYAIPRAMMKIRYSVARGAAS